jgi:hypothetical protein
MFKINSVSTTFALITSLVLSSCALSKKMDVYVAEQYGNKLPTPAKKKNADVAVSSTIPFTPQSAISVTTKKTSKVLPLIVYIHFDYRHSCAINPAVAVTSFTNTLNQQSARLNQKLNGQQLELTVEQAPNTFAIVDKATMVLILIHWDRLYVEPDGKDLIVSYRVLQNGTATKTGKISVKNEEHDKGIRIFQSWKSCTREYLSRYNSDVTNMSKSFVTKLLEEL